MALLRFTPSQPNATTVTTTNLVSLPSGKQAVTVATGGAGNTVTYSSDFVKNGINSIKVFAQASASVAMRLPFDTTDKMSGAISFYYRVETPLTAGLCIATVRHASGVALRIVMTGGNAVSVQNTAGVAVASTATGVWQTGQWTRIDVIATVATTTTGSFTLNVYNNDSTSPSGTCTASNGDFGTAPLTSMDIGVPAVVPAAYTEGIVQYFAAPALHDGVTTQIGPWVSNAFVISHTETVGYCRIDLTDSTPGGLTHTISPTTNVLEPSEGIFFVPQSASARVYTVTSLNGSESITTNITVPALGTTSDSLRIRVYSGGVWSDS